MCSWQRLRSSKRSSAPTAFFAHLPGEFLTLMETPEFKATLAGSAGFTAGFKMLKQFRPIARRQLTAEWKAAERFKPDLIIYHPKAIGVPSIGEKLHCPTVLASPLPGFTPTGKFASPMVPFRSVGLLNRLTHMVMADGADALFKSMISDWRVSELGLSAKPAHRLRQQATLYAYSPVVIPVPDDWPASVAVTGYWFLDDDSDWRPDAALTTFLDAGDPPVYVGFGSVPGLDPVVLTKAVVDALRNAGKRGVLATGGGALLGNVMAGHIHVIDGAPHDKLFSLMAACIHHGGAGTTAAALRAGRPQVICPFFGDQPFWARRMTELGVATDPLPLKQITAERLTFHILKATNNPAMSRRARAVASAVTSEDGVTNAMDSLKTAGLILACVRPQADRGDGRSSPST